MLHSNYIIFNFSIKQIDMKKLHSFASMLILTIIMFTSYSTFAQNNSNQNPFSIKANYENGELHLKCDSGCSWGELSFTLDDSGNAQLINEFGMTSKKDEQKSNEHYAHFLISFQKAGSKITCESLSGTDWDKRDFQCIELSCKAVIDKAGVTVPK